MSTQLNLLGRSVKVRPTSIEARRSISKESITKVKAVILDVLARHGPLTDEVIAKFIAHYEMSADKARPGLRLLVSASGLRTRRSELVKAGKVEACGQTRNARGLNVTLWRIK